MTFDELIRARRSIRKYQDRPVPEEMLHDILETGRLAPSGHNYQNWRFTVVKDADARTAMVDACNGQPMVAQAPVNLVVWAEEERIMKCHRSAPTIDGSIALAFMVLKATDLGLGTCWLANFSEEKVKALLRLPETAVVVAVCALGWPDEAPKPRPRKALDEIVDLRP